MSFADYHDIYRICTTYNGGGQSSGIGKLGMDMTPSSSVSDLQSAHSNRWWELVEKEIQQEKRETVLI
ncbi:hypothetical protein [Neobacillus vireti]|uniref:hypothetical protein n=1 Tax=Neobacillus vireti TaxID=220686 RepID=UPI002FFD9B67